MEWWVAARLSACEYRRVPEQLLAGTKVHPDERIIGVPPPPKTVAGEGHVSGFVVRGGFGKPRGFVTGKSSSPFAAG